MIPLCQQIWRLRKRRKLTQSELADLVGTTQSWISQLEGGEIIPSLRMLRHLAEALGCELRVLFVERRR